MNFDLTEDMSAVLAGISPLLAKFSRLPDPAESAYYIYGDALDSELAESGFFEIAREEGFGAAEASLLVEQIARTPYAVESAASMIVAAQISPLLLPRPVALIQGLASGPVRFLSQAKTAIIDAGNEVRILDMTGIEVTPVDTIFAYPFGRVAPADLAKSTVMADVTPAQLRHWWRLALSTEMLGAARSSLDLTVDFVKQREQFGRPLGSFQAVQHRLSACATLVEGLELLVRRAAWSCDPADAALAASYAQETASQLIYDFHQFHGAMGLTLEYVLHHWTYRLKILAGELGGASAQASDAATLVYDGRQRPIEARV